MQPLSILTTRDEPSGLVITTATGVLTMAALLQFMNTEWASSDRPILFDGREATGEQLSVEDVQRLADTAASLHGASRLRARLAIVVGTDTEFGLARMFVSLSEMRGVTHVRVFRSMSDAAEWLL